VGGRPRGGIRPRVDGERDRSLLIGWVYLVALTVAEVLTALFEPRVGLVLHAGLLVGLFIHTALSWEHPYHRLLLGLSFAPLIRLLSLSLPLARFPLLYWYFIISVPLFVATFVAVRVLGLRGREIGLTLRRPLAQLGIALTGLVFGAVEYQILYPDPLVQRLTWGTVWLPALILLVSTGFAEELIFRGVMQRVAVETLGRFGVLYVAMLFAVLHVGYHSLLDVFFVFIVAMVFGWVRERTGSIVGVSIAHGITNIVLFLVMPFSPPIG
jgi:hypothetical protein